MLVYQDKKGNTFWLCEPCEEVLLALGRIWFRVDMTQRVGLRIRGWGDANIHRASHSSVGSKFSRHSSTHPMPSTIIRHRDTSLSIEPKIHFQLSKQSSPLFLDVLPLQNTERLGGGVEETLALGHRETVRSSSWSTGSRPMQQKMMDMEWESLAGFRLASRYTNIPQSYRTLRKIYISIRIGEYGSQSKVTGEERNTIPRNTKNVFLNAIFQTSNQGP